MSLDSIDPTLIAIGLLIVILTTIFLWIRRSPSNRKYILLLGNSSCGKTSIYSKLVFKKNLSTHISFKENKSTIVSDKHKKSIELVDIPGYANIRQKFIDQYKKQTKGIVFVVDSESISKELKDVAIETLCKTTSAALNSTSDQKSSKNFKLKSDAKVFEFNNLKYYRVEFCECSAIDTDKPFSTEPITRWIDEVMK